MQPGASGQGARAERAVPVDQVQAVEVGVPELELGADLMVEQRQLDAELAQRLTDRSGLPAAPRPVLVGPTFPGLLGVCSLIQMIGNT